MSPRNMPDRTGFLPAYHSAGVYGVLAIGIAWWILFLVLTGITLEDALITFRYAQNLALGHGFVFNPGERVLGTTTPLLTLFLALAGKVFGVAAIPLTSTLCMLGCGILTAILVDRVLVEIGRPPLVRTLFLVLYFGSEDLVVTSTGGMETPLVLCLMAGSSLAYVRGRPVACLALCALLVLTRVDGIVWAGTMIVALTVQHRKVPWKAMLLSSGFVLPWILFAIWYFGSPLPNSIAAKQAIGTATHHSPALSLYGARRFVTWYLTSKGWVRAPVPLLLGRLALLAVGAGSFLVRPAARKFGMILTAFAGLYALFLHAGRAPYFKWYLAPFALCAAVLLAAALWEVSKGLSRLISKAVPSLRTQSAIALALAAVLCFSQNRGRLAHHREVQANEATRRTIGLWLADNTPADSVVAMEAIGYQAYFSERIIVDFAGIVSPRVVQLKRKSRSNGELFHRILTAYEPDYLVLRSYEVDENEHFDGGRLFESLGQREFFERNYRELKRFAVPYPERWGKAAFMTLYVRRTPDPLHAQLLRHDPSLKMARPDRSPVTNRCPPPTIGYQKT